MIKTAEEIRKITASPSSKAKKILKDIEKEIVRQAKNGNRSLDYFKYDTSKDVIDEIIKELRDAGYKVSTIKDISDPRENDGYCVTFTIRW